MLSLRLAREILCDQQLEGVGLNELQMLQCRLAVFRTFERCSHSAAINQSVS